MEKDSKTTVAVERTTFTKPLIPQHYYKYNFLST